MNNILTRIIYRKLKRENYKRTAMPYQQEAKTSTKSEKQQRKDEREGREVHGSAREKAATGYLLAFLTSFERAAWPRSRPHTSARRTKQSNTSDTSSSKCSLSAAVQFGSPLSTSPFHWNISDSSPTSPTCNQLQFYQQQQQQHVRLSCSYPLLIIVCFQVETGD